MLVWACRGIASSLVGRSMLRPYSKVNDQFAAAAES
jgi:hypothetical protein